MYPKSLYIYNRNSVSHCFLQYIPYVLHLYFGFSYLHLISIEFIVLTYSKSASILIALVLSYGEGRDAFKQKYCLFIFDASVTNICAWCSYYGTEKT